MINNETDVMILARTIYGEARGEFKFVGMQSLEAVAWVVKNRALKKSITAVCLQPFQFSCWNKHDPNLCKVMKANFDDKILRTCFLAATNVLFGDVIDCTNGANHYHSTSIATPYWAANAKPTIKIANHVFYKL